MRSDSFKTAQQNASAKPAKRIFQTGSRHVVCFFSTPAVFPVIFLHKK